MSEPGAPPRAALALVSSGWLVLVAGGFVKLPFALALAAALAAAAGGSWIAWAGRRWQSAFAVVAMLYWFGRPALERHTPPPGGTGTLVTLVAFAVLVLGGAWVGSRSANS